MRSTCRRRGSRISYRRLVADRAGWRGAKGARLTIAHHFARDVAEAEIRCENTIRWINWYVRQPHDRDELNPPGPDAKDYAAILFHKSIAGEFDSIDTNLSRWNDAFSFSASAELVRLLELYDPSILRKLVAFASGKKSSSKMLKLRLLASPRLLTSKQIKQLAAAIGTPLPIESDDRESFSLQPSKTGSGQIVSAALTALVSSSRKSAATIIGGAGFDRPSSYDFGEHHGYSRAWTTIRYAAVRTWSAGKQLRFHHLLPRG